MINTIRNIFLPHVAFVAAILIVTCSASDLIHAAEIGPTNGECTDAITNAGGGSAALPISVTEMTITQAVSKLTADSNNILKQICTKTKSLKVLSDNGEVVKVNWAIIYRLNDESIFRENMSLILDKIRSRHQFTSAKAIIDQYWKLKNNFDLHTFVTVAMAKLIVHANSEGKLESKRSANLDREVEEIQSLEIDFYNRESSLVEIKKIAQLFELSDNATLGQMQKVLDEKLSLASEEYLSSIELGNHDRWSVDILFLPIDHSHLANKSFRELWAEYGNTLRELLGQNRSPLLEARLSIILKLVAMQIGPKGKYFGLFSNEPLEYESVDFIHDFLKQGSNGVNSMALLLASRAFVNTTYTDFLSDDDKANEAKYKGEEVTLYSRLSNTLAGIINIVSL